jgi:hypothetical protein
MANIDVICQDFTAAYASTNGQRRRDVSRRAVLRAVITVGAQRFQDVLSLGLRGLLHRFAMGLSAFSFLDQSPAGLCLSDDYRSLDMSEKGAATYWYGMAFAKIVADSELGIAWLAHVDEMRENGALVTSSGSNERGDLVGRGMNDWHVVEAKGRSNPYPSTLVTKAKGQSARIVSVNGQPPATTSACITSLFTKPISVLLDDPQSDAEGNEEHWTIRKDRFFVEYYRGIIEYLRGFGPRREKRVDNAVFVVAPLFPFFWDFFHFPHPPPFPEWRLELGLMASICEAPEQAPEAVGNLPYEAEGKIGSDGIAIFGRMPTKKIT